MVVLIYPGHDAAQPVGRCRPRAGQRGQRPDLLPRPVWTSYPPQHTGLALPITSAATCRMVLVIVVSFHPSHCTGRLPTTGLAGRSCQANGQADGELSPGLSRGRVGVRELGPGCPVAPTATLEAPVNMTPSWAIAQRWSQNQRRNSSARAVLCSRVPSPACAQRWVRTGLPGCVDGLGVGQDVHDRAGQPAVS
jgi:hypothetical protein